MVGEACLPINAYYPRTPDYTLCSGVHVCWSEHSDSSFVYGFMILDYGFGTMTATTSFGLTEIGDSRSTKRANFSAFRTFVRFCGCLLLSVSPFSSCLGWATACDCGTPWTFLSPHPPPPFFFFFFQMMILVIGDALSL